MEIQIQKYFEEFLNVIYLELQTGVTINNNNYVYRIHSKNTYEKINRLSNFMYDCIQYDLNFSNYINVFNISSHCHQGLVDHSFEARKKGCEDTVLWLKNVIIPAIIRLFMKHLDLFKQLQIYMLN